MKLVPSFMAGSVKVDSKKAAELPVSVNNLVTMDNYQKLTS